MKHNHTTIYYAYIFRTYLIYNLVTTSIFENNILGANCNSDVIHGCFEIIFFAISVSHF